MCPTCMGARLRKESLFVKIKEKNILEVNNMTITEAKSFIESLNEKSLSKNEYIIAKQILKELSARLGFLVSVGLNYLTLSRKAKSLSGGESQRIRLASQIGSGLTGVLYVLDEPSIGLHQKDNEKLIKTLKYLRDLGNTVIVVEHDEDTIHNADHIVDIGPKAGEHGGEIIFEGTLQELKKSKTLTADYISKRRVITKEKILKDIRNIEKDVNDLEVERIKKTSGKFIEVLGASENDSKDISVKFPLGKFITVTGASGSGKSTLVNDILAKALMKEIYDSKDSQGSIKG